MNCTYPILNPGVSEPVPLISAKNSSLGWNPAEKRLELFHQQARYIFVYFKDGGQFTEEPAAYTSFRFEKEDTRSIVYW